MVIGQCHRSCSKRYSSSEQSHVVKREPSFFCASKFFRRSRTSLFFFRWNPSSFSVPSILILSHLCLLLVEGSPWRPFFAQRGAISYCSLPPTHPGFSLCSSSLASMVRFSIYEKKKSFYFGGAKIKIGSHLTIWDCSEVEYTLFSIETRPTDNSAKQSGSKHHNTDSTHDNDDFNWKLQMRPNFRMKKTHNALCDVVVGELLIQCWRRGHHDIQNLVWTAKDPSRYKPRDGLLFVYY